ncbi:MAG: Thiol-disulfide oxidoreductase ResA [Syntrophus sp. SKADARSKE-3]|nr:Thiol-disulfide oxidoreductase ResA [Syntrophus sp. SKADARSKE-3]
MKGKPLFIALIMMGLLVAGAIPCAVYAQEKAPDFSLYDLQGKPFRLSSYGKAKAVLLIFGTTWCPSCRSEIPHFKNIYAAYAPKGLEVAYVNIQEPREKAARFSAKNQLPYRTLLDLKGDVSMDYNISGVPAMVLIKDGRVVTRTYRLIDGYLEKLFKK